jgi:hypothetical protein
MWRRQDAWVLCFRRPNVHRIGDHVNGVVSRTSVDYAPGPSLEERDAQGLVDRPRIILTLPWSWWAHQMVRTMMSRVGHPGLAHVHKVRGRIGNNMPDHQEMVGLLQNPHLAFEEQFLGAVMKMGYYQYNNNVRPTSRIRKNNFSERWWKWGIISIIITLVQGPF